MPTNRCASLSTSRFAPSATGPAHPGTLLAALLCWLDARSRGGRVVLRLEDLDPERCRPEFTRGLIDDLAWLGLEWDTIVEQHDLAPQHEAALDRLAAAGRLYPCAASRSDLKAAGRHAPDGGWAYDNRGRGTPLPSGGWRACNLPLRVRLDDDALTLTDESGLNLSQCPATAFGDPVVRRRDGAMAYQLVVVVDDAAAGVDRVVRGRDIAPSTALQVMLQRLLGLPTPDYRHHLLLLEERDRKLAKLHGAVGLPELRRHYAAPELCGWLAWSAGLLDQPMPCAPADLLRDFTWARVRRDDVIVRWTGKRLEVVDGI
jgi:glutamyl/glutaminyl-tRNA synthetase